MKPDKINNEASEMPNIQEEASKINAIKEKIGSHDHDNIIERGKGNNKNDSEAPQNGTINSEVTNTHTDYELKKDDSTSLEMWIEPKEHYSFPPAGDEISMNQNGYPVGGPGPLEYSRFLLAKREDEANNLSKLALKTQGEIVDDNSNKKGQTIKSPTTIKTISLSKLNVE